mmetsp:Transcript_13468/g.31671  ORF Transcript_13468/g.31671 Transcript_13468/m.31671 type:complete len:154 (+) Transcript_13468:59-520(+)
MLGMLPSALSLTLLLFHGLLHPANALSLAPGCSLESELYTDSTCTTEVVSQSIEQCNGNTREMVQCSNGLFMSYWEARTWSRPRLYNSRCAAVDQQNSSCWEWSFGDCCEVCSGVWKFEWTSCTSKARLQRPLLALAAPLLYCLLLSLTSAKG